MGWVAVIGRCCRWRCLAVLWVALAGCNTVPRSGVDEIRENIDWKVQDALNAFLDDYPDLEKKLESVPGYVVGTNDVLLLGALGSGSAVAVLFDQRDQSRTYLDINSLGMGVGLGARGGRFLILLKSEAAVDKAAKGRWLLNPSMASNVGESRGALPVETDALTVYVGSESGVSAGAGVSLTKIKVNRQLTDTGVASFNVPNRNSAYRHSQDETAPRRWNRTLPFLGQRAVDRGFDLPLPIGVSVIRADVRQEMDLTKLRVGFNGGQKIPYRFVSFGADSDLVTEQLKLDAWVLPFMNLYATLGQVRGDLALDISLDGDTLAANSGKDCSRIPKPLVCRLFEGKQVRFPIDVDIDPKTYGVGTVLAAGWRDWFFVLPFNVTWSEPDDTTLDGRAFTFAPRAGHAFALNRAGRLALFVGGNYLDSRNVASGDLPVPGTDVILGYEIHQENEDRWNLLTGFNWDVTPRLSLMAEYDGFVGGREAFITSLNVRF